MSSQVNQPSVQEITDERILEMTRRSLVYTENLRLKHEVNRLNTLAKDVQAKLVQVNQENDHLHIWRIVMALVIALGILAWGCTHYV